MTFGFQDRIAWVTGAASGIGAATARLLASEGANVACLDINHTKLTEVVDEINANGGTAMPVTADVTNWDVIRDATADLAKQLGPVDTVIASAGIVHPPADVVDLDIDAWQRTLDVNITGVFLTAKAAIPQLLRGRHGAIVIISSVGGLRGSPKYAGYVTAKHGVLGLMRVLANELASAGIRVNALCPGTVETPMLDDQAAHLGVDRAAAAEKWAREHLLNRLLTPEEIANGAAWLASDYAAMVTGVALPFDGGFLARPPT